MVLLPEGYCIDSTEVTRVHYDAWLATSPAAGGQPPACSWNNTYEPEPECMAMPPVCQGSSCGAHPQTCIDWCDAVAYCQAVGKRLCGQIGGASNHPDDYADETMSQWYNACSSHGLNDFNYGDVYQPELCNTEQAPTVEVGSLPACQSSVSGYQGVYDLSGNVAEWEDCCEGVSSANDMCLVRGGAIAADGDFRRCDGWGKSRRDVGLSLLGFRCCLDR